MLPVRRDLTIVRALPGGAGRCKPILVMLPASDFSDRAGPVKLRIYDDGVAAPQADPGLAGRDARRSGVALRTGDGVPQSRGRRADGRVIAVADRGPARVRRQLLDVGADADQTCARRRSEGNTAA